MLLIFVRETSPGAPWAAAETSTSAISHVLGGPHTLALLNQLNIGRQSALWKWRLPRHAWRKHARSHAVCAGVTITPLFFSVNSHVLVSFVTLLLALHRLSTVFLSVLSLGKICLAVRVMASGSGPPQLRRVRRGSSCFKRVQSISASPFVTCCCRCCFAGR